MRYKWGKFSSMCGINNVLTFVGNTNHKMKLDDILLLISLFLSVVSVRDMIENRQFFVAPVCVIIWPELVKFQKSKCLKYTHKKGYMYNLWVPLPIGVQRWQIRPIQLITINTSYWFVYDCSSLILKFFCFMNVWL